MLVNLRFIVLTLSAIWLVSCNRLAQQTENNYAEQVEVNYVSPSNITVFWETDILRICPLTAAGFIREVDSNGKYIHYISLDSAAGEAYRDLEALLRTAKSSDARYIPPESRHRRIERETWVNGERRVIVVDPDTLNHENIGTDCLILYTYEGDATSDTICLLTTASNNIIRLNSHLAKIDSLTFCRARECVWSTRYCRYL